MSATVEAHAAPLGAAERDRLVRRGAEARRRPVLRPRPVRRCGGSADAHGRPGAGRELAGIGLAAASAVAMPWFGFAKRRVGRRLRSAATRSDGTQNLLCAYLAIAVLAELSLNAAFGWWWADPLAALVVAGVAVREGVESWRGDECR